MLHYHLHYVLVAATAIYFPHKLNIIASNLVRSKTYELRLILNVLKSLRYDTSAILFASLTGYEHVKDP